jgi:lysophospholipase L1-like esterase
MSAAVRSALKVVGYNVLILFVLANLGYWAIPTVDLISRLFNGEPAIAGDYRSFIGWRHLPQETPLGHVDAGRYPQRRTINPNPDSRKVYFFGGSTMWGLHITDKDTIPSHFAALTNFHSENFGEIGYTAHQGLVLLLQLLQERQRPDLVFFYDGVNDVAIKCQRGFTPESDGRELEIRALMEGHDHPSSFAYHLRAVTRLAGRISHKVTKLQGQNYECDRDLNKAAAIADNLVKDWQMARLLVEAFGGKFVGVLQPVAFLSEPRPNGLDLDPHLGQQYQVVYPLVRQKMKGQPFLHDLSAALDRETDKYLDFNHLNAPGNRLISEQLAAIANTFALAPANP